MTDEERNRADAAALVQAAAKVTGATVGGGIGFFIAGPPGGLAGAVAGSLVEVGADFAHRQLSRRQEIRVGTVLLYAADRAWHRIQNGDQIRDDGFFTMQGGGRRPSEEVGEAVLLAVRDEAETRKAPYLGYLVGNVGFESAVGERTAHAMVTEAEGLTYTQFCLLGAREAEAAVRTPYVG